MVMREMKVKNSIRWQMVVVICGVIFVSFLMFATIIRNILIDDYRELMQKNDKQLLQILSHNIENAISKPLELEHTAAISPLLVQLNEEDKIKMLKGILMEDSSFELLSIIDPDGTHITNSIPTNQSLESLYKEYKELKNGTGFGISNVHYSNSTQNLIFTFVQDLKSNDTNNGAIIAHIKLNDIRDAVMKYNNQSHTAVYLIDNEGTAIAQPDSIGDGLYNYKSMKVTKFQRDHGSIIVQDKNGNFKTTERAITVPTGFADSISLAIHGASGETQYSNEIGEKFFCVYQPIKLPFVNTKWTLILTHSEADMTAIIDRLFVKALVAGFIMLIFASFTILYFSDRLTKPIFQIVEMANRVRAGDLSGQLNIKDENEIGLLAENINHMIQGLRATRQKSKEAENQIKAIAYHDTLTGLPNRMHFMIYLRDIFEKSIHGRFYASLLFIDVDKFKSVNDTYGHAVGDGLLIAFSKRIVDIAGRKEIACRFGGDEFLLFLVGYDANATKYMCEKLVKVMREPFNISGNEFSLSTSIGAALFPKDASSIDELMEKADAALYVSKRNGRDQYNFYEEGMQTKPIDERD